MQKQTSLHPYYQVSACLLTKHHKQQVIAPVLADKLAIRLQVDDTFDTDTLGTFTRTVARVEDQLATAERKARLAAERSNFAFGIGSEGSFDTKALGGLACINSEILVWFDASRDVCISANHQTVVAASTLTTSDYAELKKYAIDNDFPEQALVLRAGSETDPYPVSGIQSFIQLERAFVDCLSRSTNHQVFAEWDFRALYCPCRMQTIARAAHQLAGHLLRRCPECRAPGYHLFKSRAGLPCQQCHAPTATVMGRYYRCAVCQAQHFEPVSDEYSNPFNCSICNP